jgi:hypothetical protein
MVRHALQGVPDRATEEEDSYKRCVFDGRVIADGFDLLPARLELAVKLTATVPPGPVSFDSPTSALFRAPRWEK